MARKTSPVVVESHELTKDQTPGLTRAAESIRQLPALEAQLETTVRAVAAQIGYLLPADCTDPDLIQRDISANMRRSVEACLEVGRGLAVLKAASGHGNFMARLDVLGIDRFVAAKFVQAATKFSNVPSNAHLLKAIGNQTKLFEMLVLDDEQLEELELTGQTGELHLDKIATMSVKELRAALREAQEDAKATDKVMGNITGQKHALEKELARAKRRIEASTPDEIGQELRAEIAQLSFNAEAAILGALTEGFHRLEEHASANNCTHEEFMSGCLAQIERALIGLRNRFNVKVVPDGNEIPDWLRPGAEEKAAEQVLKDIAKAGKKTKV